MDLVVSQAKQYTQRDKDFFLSVIDSLPRRKHRYKPEDEFAVLKVLDYLIRTKINLAGLVYSSQGSISQAVDLGIRQVQRALDVLKRYGLVVVRSRSNKRAKIYRTNTYTLHDLFFDPYIVRSLYPLLASLRYFLKNVMQYYKGFNLLKLNRAYLVEGVLTNNNNKDIYTLYEQPEDDPPPKSYIINEKATAAAAAVAPQPFVSTQSKYLTACRRCRSTRHLTDNHDQAAREWRSKPLPPRSNATLSHRRG